MKLIAGVILSFMLLELFHCAPLINSDDGAYKEHHSSSSWGFKTGIDAGLGVEVGRKNGLASLGIKKNIGLYGSGHKESDDVEFSHPLPARPSPRIDGGYGPAYASPYAPGPYGTQYAAPYGQWPQYGPLILPPPLPPPQFAPQWPQYGPQYNPQYAYSPQYSPQAAPQYGQQGAPQNGPQATSQYGPQAAPQYGLQAAPPNGPQAAPQNGPQATPQYGPQAAPPNGPQAAPQNLPQTAPQNDVPQGSAIYDPQSTQDAPHSPQHGIKKNVRRE